MADHTRFRIKTEIARSRPQTEREPKQRSRIESPIPVTLRRSSG
jgi:hypothetical protein